jgi:membrane fusion protein, multidrug efflux system
MRKRQNEAKRHGRALLALLTCMACLTLPALACSRPKAGAQEVGGNHNGDNDPVSVVTAPVVTRTMPVTIPAVGTVEAINRVEIHAQVTGQLREILFTPGTDVRKGQPLFTLDRRPFEAALRQSEAVVAKDTAQLNDAKVQHERFQNLFNRGLIPRDQLDTQSANTAALQATLEADQATAEQARLNLQYASISAPLAGRTGAPLAYVGDLVRANDTTPLVTINQLSPIDVAFSVPARLLADIRRYESQGPLVVTATAQPGTLPGAAAPAEPEDDEEGEGSPKPTATGRITFIDNLVDNKTATILLKATFDNSGHVLWPGLFVQVSLRLAEEPNVLVVPAVAVQASQRGQYVYVVKPDQTVEIRNVAVRRQQGDLMVIASGLSQGELVVTEGQLRLTPGARIVSAGRTSS